MRKNDLTGKRVGILKVIEPTDKRSTGGNVIWKCQCECGNYREVSSSDIVNNQVYSCGCKKEEAHRYNLTDGIYGQLKAIKPLDNKLDNNTEWLCECMACGNKEVIYPANKLQYAQVTTCGCHKWNKNRKGA